MNAPSWVVVQRAHVLEDAVESKWILIWPIKKDVICCAL